jgi:hypothetical protein
VKVYITVLALQKGILEGNVPDGTPLTRNINVTPVGLNRRIFVKAGDWHLSMPDARSRAQAIVNREIESYETYLDTLRNRRF